MKRKVAYLFSFCLVGLALALFLSIPSNNDFEDSLVGRYENDLKTKTETFYYGLQGVAGTVMGCKLDIYINDNFRYECCGAIYSGKYHIEKDKLYLDSSNVEYKTESIDTSVIIVDTLKKHGFFDFTIKNEKLLGVVKGITTKGKSLNKLVVND